MRVVFLGTPEFSVPTLNALLGSPYDVVAAFTQPDRPSGRGQRPVSPPVKLVAQRAGIPVFQPMRIKSDEDRAHFASLDADFLVVAAYGQILPGWLLRSARIAPVNIHASLLPRYRGAAPVVWALLNGETTTGVTTMLMEEQLDSGPILLHKAVPVAEETTAGELSAVLAAEGAALILPTLDGLSNDSIRPQAQVHEMATWAPRIEKDSARLRWDLSARQVHNRIRAYNPWPLAFTEFRGLRVQVLRSLPEPEPTRDPLPPGCCLGKEGTSLRIQCGGGTVIRIQELKVQDRQPVSGEAFANGFHILPGAPVFPGHPGLTP
jgi:methionyl-tRNA formyltransferase